MIEKIEAKSKELLSPYEKAAMFDLDCPECGHQMKDISIMNDPNHFFGQGSPE
jgi:ssDNA-binding Zn-finger/Zn-ribbon topoisomerase 1